MDKTKRGLVVVLSLVILSACRAAPEPKAPDTATPTIGSPEAESKAEGAAAVFFTSPSDGATVRSPVRATMGTKGFSVEPAGEVHPNAGHLHIMVDTQCVPEGQVIPNDATHLHFGKAQTEAEIALAPGEHTLCLQAGDGAHTALDLTQAITVSVGR